jgi:antitoxin (DNA-binding transcriptional repressor) of toxin-antitoxin stability system
MQSVGVRERKAKLSHSLRVAKTRDTVLVNEHGRVIAALGLPAMAELPPELAGLQALVAESIAGTWSTEAAWFVSADWPPESGRYE